MKSVTALSAATALFSGSANAFWRMPCHSRTGLVRLDPLVEPDTVSNHGHTIHGGNNFGMSTKYDDLRESQCTSCQVKEDKSAYWTPSLHFIHANGTTEVVPQIGGMLAYYLLLGEDLEPFPAGFKMLAGDTRLRNFTGEVPDPEKSLWGKEDKTQLALGQKAIGMNCLNYGKEPEGSMYRHFLPEKSYLDSHCADGIRAELFFPSCWNGELDSDNHRDHMAYPDLVNGGSCPDSHPTRVPSLFFETIWGTNHFKDVDGQFVFANGDPTGYGYHGDFIMGWPEQLLSDAVKDCTNPSGRVEDCPHFMDNDGTQDESTMDDCKMEQPKLNMMNAFDGDNTVASLLETIFETDNCAGPADGLCGNVPVQNGPEYASPLKPGDRASPTAGYTPPPSTDMPAMPTLTYQSATSAITDQYGGGISAASVPTKLPNEGEAKAAEAPEPEEQESASSSATPTPSPEPEPESEAESEAEAPAVTPAPAPEPVDDNANIISTSTYTSAGVVYEVAVEQVDVYVTVDAPAAPPKHRRHAHHKMHRRDREHGLLGRY